MSMNQNDINNLNINELESEIKYERESIEILKRFPFPVDEAVLVGNRKRIDIHEATKDFCKINRIDMSLNNMDYKVEACFGLQNVLCGKIGETGFSVEELRKHIIQYKEKEIAIMEALLLAKKTEIIPPA